MADNEKISALDAIAVAAGTDVLAAVQAGATKRLTIAQILGVEQTAADISGGAIDGTPIGGSTPAAGAFTTLAASGGFVSTGGNVQIDRSGDGVDATIFFDADAGESRLLEFRTGTSARWKVGANNTAEGGANAGSDFRLQSFNDAGSYIATVLLVTRSTGKAAFGAAVSVAGALTAAGGVDGVVGGVTPAAGSFTTLGASAAVTLQPTQRLYFDDGVDTYITEIVADKLRFVVGSSVLLDLSPGGGAEFSAGLSTTADFAVNPNKFTVAAATGNTVVAGTLGVTGDVTLTGILTRANSAGYYWSAQGAAAVAVAGTYVKVSTASSTTSTRAENFTISTNNRATYTGVSTQTFRVSYAVTVTSSNNNQITGWVIAKNGTPVAATVIHRRVGTGTDEGALVVEGFVEFAQNDYVEFWGTNNDAIANVAVEHGTCTITEA